MLTILGSFLGFFGSFIPEIFKIFQDNRDKIHELKIMELQLQQQKDGNIQKLEAINIQSATSETKEMYKTFYSGNKKADFLNGIVRPIIALGFFTLYSVLKLLAYSTLPAFTLDSLHIVYQVLWTEEDGAIFAGIISFYFGHRAFNKMRG